MNRFCLTLIAFSLMAFVWSSCDQDEYFKKPVEWEKIEFPNEGAIYAIEGDLKDYLLISTISKILRTDDGGKNWVVVANVISPAGDFMQINDDLYAITNDIDYVSHDQGKTWLSIKFDYELTPATGTFTDSKGILYESVYHSHGELALPTTLLRSIDKGNSWETVFPHKHVFYATHIDAHDRLYIGTWGAVWDGSSFGESPQNTAYLYYMK